MLISLNACGQGRPGWPAASTAPAAPSLHRVRSFGFGYGCFWETTILSQQSCQAVTPVTCMEKIRCWCLGASIQGLKSAAHVIIKVLPAPHSEGKQLVTCSVRVGTVGHQLLINVFTFRQKERAAVQKAHAPPAMRLYEALDMAVYPIYGSCEPAVSNLPLIREA